MVPLPPNRIFDRAVAALNELRGYPTWQASLDAATPEPTPLYVRTLTLPPDFSTPLFDYFIVSVKRGQSITARFAHNAETGEFLEAEAVRKAGVALAAYVDPLRALEKRMPVPSGSAPEVVWMPCVESTSRFLPFWMFQIDGRPIFVRGDGEVFDRLSFRIKG